MLRERLSAAVWEDGRASATGTAAKAKRNLQLANDCDGASEMREVVARGLYRSEPFCRASLPKVVLPPVFNRHDAGMQYGPHVDAPTSRGPGEPARLDVSVTVFLSDPTTYDGGELVIMDIGGETAVKLPAGDAVVYPASTLHRVAAVRSGTRLAAVSWVQSFVRDPARRVLLSELEWARVSLESRGTDARGELDVLAKCYANLFRMWMD